MSLSTRPPQLLSRACTSGWLDWVWGDLWLTSDHLVRLSRGWTATVRAAQERKQSGRGSTIDDAPATTDVSTIDLERLVRSKRTNRSILLANVRHAKLRRGILNSRLRVELAEGRRIKLLWLKQDPAYDVIAEVLRERLGEALELR